MVITPFHLCKVIALAVTKLKQTEMHRFFLPMHFFP